MPRLNVQWVREHDFKSFPEIAHQPGYYLDVLTGDVFRNSGSFTDTNRRILSDKEDSSSLHRKPFLLVTDDLRMTINEVKQLAASKFGVDHQALGKMVHSME